MINLLTPKDVARLLNCKPSSLYAWAKEGKIPAIKLNGLLRFDPREIEEWINNNKINASPVKGRTIVKTVRTVGKTDVDDIVSKVVDAHVKSR